MRLPKVGMRKIEIAGRLSLLDMWLTRPGQFLSDVVALEKALTGPQLHRRSEDLLEIPLLPQKLR